MKYLHLLLITTLLMLTLGAVTALADPINFAINFKKVESSAAAPTSDPSGGFGYDSSTKTFTWFTVAWNGKTFDLTSSANSGAKVGNPSCLNGLTGGAASFALLNGQCASAPQTNWLGEAFYSGGSKFTLFTWSSVGSLDIVNGGGAYTGGREYSQGTWTLTNVPEPSSIVTLSVGLLALAGFQRRRKRQEQVVRL